MLKRALRRELEDARRARDDERDAESSTEPQSVIERWAPAPSPRPDAPRALPVDDPRDGERGDVGSGTSAPRVASERGRLSSHDTGGALRELVDRARSARRGSVWFREQAERPNDTGGYRESATRDGAVARLEIHLRRPGDELGVMALLLCVAALAWIPWASEAGLSLTTVLSPLALGATLLVMATRSWGWCHIAIEGERAEIRTGGRSSACDLADLRCRSAPPHLTTGVSGRVTLSDDDVSRLLPALIHAYRAHLRAVAEETRG